jgi:ABC-type nitrate/sulfonate/bicarbonate transport system substrate-binding protein
MTGAWHNRLVQVVVVANLTVAVVALGYIGTRNPLPAPHILPEKLTIALPTLPHFALVHVAAAKGYFTEEGLDVSILPVSHGVAAIGHMLQEKADLAFAADVPFVIAIMNGNALGMLASVGSVSNDNAIIARRDHAITAPGDLAGKKIGATFGSSGSYFLWAFLIRHKLSPDSITLVNLPPEQIVQALVSGNIDAVVTWQPRSSDAQTALGNNALSFTAAGIYKNTSTVIGCSEFLKGRANANQKFVRALLKAEHFMQTRPEETLNLIAGWLMSEPDKLRSTWTQFDFKVNLLQSHLITLEDEARWAMARGYAAKGPVPNFLPHLHLDALLAVQPERVTVLR